MTKRLIDLSHPLEAATPPWPGNPPVQIVVISTIPADRGPGDRGKPGTAVECNTTAFLTCNHTGTHMDAPAHFYNGKPTIEQMPLDYCIGPAALVDVRHIGPRGEITPADFAMRQEAIAASGKVVFWTGWSSRWGQDGYFDDYPVLSEATARWLVVIVENLTSLDRIDREVFDLIVVPLPLQGLEASPVRAVASVTIRTHVPLGSRSGVMSDN